jgi:tripartite-type tricarboxylate transporter receptor subunit TctC
MTDAFSSLTRRQWLATSSAAALATSPWLAHAQADWPTKPLRLVVPFAPGGSSEIVARAVAGEMAKTWARTCSWTTSPARPATSRCRKWPTAPTSHTLILGHIGTLAVNPYIFAKLPYDDEGLHPDHAGLQGAQPVRGAPGPAGQEPEGVRRLRQGPARPAQLWLGGQRQRRPPGVRIPEDGHRHLRAARALPRHRPDADRPDGRPAAGRAVGAPALLQFIKAGKLRCIATGSAQRLPQLPDVPTVAEQGFKGFEMTQWYGLLVPSKWPKAHVAKIEAEAIKATRSAVVKDKLAQDTALAVGNTGAEFDAFIKAEQARWKPVIARAQIKPDGV